MMNLIFLIPRSKSLHLEKLYFEPNLSSKIVNLAKESKFSKYFSSLYSKVPPLINCIIKNSGLILVNKIPIYKKLSRLIHVQFLLQWYIVIFYGIYLNMAPISLSSLEIRMKVLSPNYYNFKKLSVLTQTISFLFNCTDLKNVFLTILTAVWNTKVFLILWYTHPALRKYILT